MVKYFEHQTSKVSETKKLGKNLAEKVQKIRYKKALVFGLKGDLGGGKTTFLQGFAKGLGIRQRVLSPTFLIMKRFKLNKSSIGQFGNFYHFDCYRIQKSKEVLDLGFKKIVSDRKNIIAVEWADRIQKIMPKNTIWISFEFVDKNKRKIQIRKEFFRFLRS